MKKFLALTMILGSIFAAHADIDLKDGFNGQPARDFIKTLRANERIEVDFGRARYVEDLMIFAEGRQRRFSFADVYADGELISTLGVPGFDPDYPVVVRGNVRKIEIVARANSRVAIRDFQIFTTPKTYNSYVRLPRAARAGYSIDDWGKHVIESVYEMYYLMCSKGLITQDEYIAYIQPMRRLAIRTQASDDARDAESIRTYRKARELAESIKAAEPLFERTLMVMDQHLDMISIDLLTIMEDISEKYDFDIE